MKKTKKVMEKDTYKKLASRQHKLIMALMTRGIFPSWEPADKKLKSAMKKYCKECLHSPLILKIINL
jgi:hypothetical protein